MTAGLLLTLTLEGASEASAEDKQVIDALISGLVHDLNDIDPGSATLVSLDEVEPGSKALGKFLLGALRAELNGEQVALKGVQHLCSHLVQQPLPIRLKLSRKLNDGAEVMVELEGSPRNQEAMQALLSQAEDVVRRLV